MKHPHPPSLPPSPASPFFPPFSFLCIYSLSSQKAKCICVSCNAYVVKRGTSPTPQSLPLLLLPLFPSFFPSPSLPPSCTGRDSQQVPVTDAESDRLRGSSRRHDRGSREEQQQTARETHPQERDSDVCGPLAQESGEKVTFFADYIL